METQIDRTICMIYPCDEISLALRKIYGDRRIRIQYSSFAFKFTHYRQWAPYLMVGTRQHIFLRSFNEKDEKKVVRIYNLKDAHLSENEDAKVAKFDNVVSLEINEDIYILRFIESNDLRNWTLLINQNVPPVLAIRNTGDVYEREGFSLNLCDKSPSYFSELCVEAEHYDAKEMAQLLSLQINLGDFAKLFSANRGILLHQGILVALQEKRDAENQNLIEEPPVNIEQLFYQGEDDSSNEERKQMHYESDWNSVFQQKIKTIKDLVSKYQEFKEPQNQSTDDEVMPDGKIDIDVPNYISSSLMQLLKTKKASSAMEMMMMEMDEVEQPTESLTGAIASFCEFLGDFRERCCQLAKLLVDEFELAAPEKTIEDISIAQNEEKMTQLKDELHEEYANFLQAAKLVDQDELEDLMTRIGPVHGSIAASQEFGSSYGQLLCQTPDFIAGTRLYSPPPPPGEAPDFCYDESNGFPNGHIDTTEDESVYISGKAVYPNPLPPVYESSVSGIRFKFAVDRDAHSGLNIRRDTLQTSLLDDLVSNEALSDVQIIQTLCDANNIEEVNELLEAPLTCVIDYCGFRLYCTAEMGEGDISFGFQDEGLLECQPRVSDEQFELVTRETAHFLNIESHLVLTRVKTALNLSKMPITSQFYGTGFANFLAERFAQYPQGTKLNKFITAFEKDISIELNHIVFDDIYNDLGDEILQEVQLSGLVQIYNEGNGKYFGKNFSALSIPDLPSHFIKNVLPKLESGSNKTASDKIAQTAFECRLPMKYTRILNEKCNPDICLSALRMRRVDIDTLSADMIEHFERVDTKRPQSSLDKRKFARFLLAYLSEYEGQSGLEQCQRASDQYRLVYLPMLMKIIDQHISANKMHMYDIPDILEHMQVPHYLWLYCANFSEFLEALEVVRLAVASKAIARYLSGNIRRIRRSIQQFGIRNVVSYEEEAIGARRPEDLEGPCINFVSAENPQRMNFFTAESKQERMNYTDALIKRYIVQLLNACFSEGSQSREFWKTIDRMVELYYYEHSFAEEYTLDVLSEQGNDLEASKFVYEHFDPQLLFRDAIGLKSAYTEKDKEIGLSKPYRLLLLDMITLQSGIIMADRGNYNFLSSGDVFSIADIVSIEPTFIMPLDQFINELANVPYRPWLASAIEIEAELTNEFSFRIEYRNDQRDQFAETKQRFIARIEPPFAHFQELFKQFHYNVSFMRFSNLYNTRSFEHLLRETAIRLSSSIIPRFGSLLHTYDPTLVREYIEVKEVAKLFISSALTIVKRNSTAGAAVYKNFIDVLQSVEDFEAELRQQMPNTLLMIHHEEQQNMSIFSDDNTNIIRTSLDAFELAMKAHVNMLSNHSMETVKLRILFAVGQYKKTLYTQALEQLKLAEETVLYKAGAGCSILMEIYNFMGLIFNGEQKQGLSLEYFDKAFNVAWLWLTTKNQLFEKLRHQKHVLEEEVVELQAVKAQKPTALKLKFVQESDEQIYIKLQRHEQALDENLGIQNSATQFTDPRGNAEIQNSSLDASLTLQSVDQNREEFPDYMWTAHEQENPQRQLIFAKQALKITESRLTIAEADFNTFNLFISQIYENHARACEKLLRTNNQDDLKEYRACAKKAYDIRSQTLGEKHPYTLQACVLVARADLQLGETQDALRKIEFALKSMPPEGAHDLNPVEIEEMPRLAIFKLLVETVLDALPNKYADVAITAEKIATSRAAAPKDDMQRVVQEVCSQENICQFVVHLVEKAYNARSEEDVNDLIYLLEYLNEEDIIEVEGNIADDEAYGRMEVETDDIKGVDEGKIEADDELY